ncbi:hypothetical protein V865_004916 [Kwoniella europaea PYCC6329]|uniref:Uncharacterized protein n=1 Tax=Kwoniella europaea PYCC6329 TaxID=1423913 RepID=A0AAX4KJX4_9TREE
MQLTATFILLASLATSGFAKIAARSGDFAVTINGKTYNPDAGKSARPDKLSACTGLIQVRGAHVGYDIDCATLEVKDYTLTGAPDAQRMVTRPTIVFSSKTPVLSPAQLKGTTITDFDLRDDGFNIIFKTGAGKFKIQSKDGAQGGIFQMETEFANNVDFVHTLGPELFYFKNAVTGKINFSNGVSSDSTHKMLLGKDSPQVATKTYQDGRTTKWSVAPGGRLGGVLGEDSTELGAGASNCTSDCQAQNRINGSIPPTQDPVDPQPLPGAKRGVRDVIYRDD